MKLLIPLIFLVAVFSSPVMSQTSLSGKVTDGDTGEELIAANVAVYKDGVFITGSASDFDGNVNITLDPGTYDVCASYVGYSSVKINGVIMRAGRVNRLNFSLGSGVNLGSIDRKRRRRKRRKNDYGTPVAKEGRVVKEILDNGPGGGN